MLALVYENTATFTAQPDESFVVSTMTLRPRLEGYETVLRGAALSAKFADEAQVSFQVRPDIYGSLSYLEAYLSVQPYPLIGVDTADDGTSGFPVPERDVSGLLTLFQGKLCFNVSLSGVCKVSLRLVSRNPDPQSMLIYTQIYGRIRPEEWEGERLGYKEA